MKRRLFLHTSSKAAITVSVMGLVGTSVNANASTSTPAPSWHECSTFSQSPGVGGQGLCAKNTAGEWRYQASCEHSTSASTIKCEFVYGGPGAEKGDWTADVAGKKVHCLY
jgi:hypothetical protein